MQRVIVSKIENVHKVQKVEYEICVSEKIRDIESYIKRASEENDLPLGKIISEETLEGELLDEEIVLIKLLGGTKQIKIV